MESVPAAAAGVADRMMAISTDAEINTTEICANRQDCPKKTLTGIAAIR